MTRLKASAQGLIKIEQARKKKGWNKLDDRACREASKILEPSVDWESEENKLANRFAAGASLETWKRFLGGKKNINFEGFKAFCQILELDYLDICQNGLVKYEVTLKANIEEISEDTIFSKIEKIKELLDIEHLTLRKIEKGSIILKLQSSIKDYQKILELSRSGQLQEILGFPIENIELETIEQTDTREWLENLFNADWQPIEAVLATSSLRSSITSTESSETTVSKAKIISLTAEQNVAIIVHFTLSDEEIQASLEIYPAANNAYLPEGLVIEILDEQEIALREEVESYTDSMQIPFSFEPEEQFKIRLTLENISITENLFNN